MKLEDLYRIGSLFKSLQWPTDDSKCAPFPRLFTRFCRMWTRLEPDQRELILELTASYRWIRHKENEDRFYRAWEKLCHAIPAQTRSIAVVNLPKPHKRGGPKSSDSMFYLAKGAMEMMRESGLHVQLLPSFSSYKGDHNTALVLMDDYVGTGNSIETALGHISQRRLFRDLSGMLKVHGSAEGLHNGSRPLS